MGAADRPGTEKPGEWRRLGRRRKRNSARRLVPAFLVPIALFAGCTRVRRDSPEALYGAADQARRRGELPDALTKAKTGLDSYRDPRQSPWPAKFQLLEAEILLTLQRTAEAQPLVEGAPSWISLWPELKARLLVDQAELQRQFGRPDEARRLLAQAYDLASAATDLTQLARIELKRGVLLYDQDHDFQGADSAFRRALDFARRTGDEALAASALGNLGYIRVREFRFDEAIPWIEAADAAGQKIPSKVEHEKCLGNLGWCYFRLGQWDRALDLYSQAEPLAAQISMLDDQQRWLGNIGVVYYARETLDKAISYYSQALEIARRIGNRESAADLLNNIARVYIDQSNWDAAEKFNRLALASASGLPQRRSVEAYSSLNSGIIAYHRMRMDDAQSAYGRAIRLAHDGRLPNVAWQAHWGLAELQRAQKQAIAAEKEYAAAIQVLDREWRALSRDDSKITFRGYMGSLYQDYVAFLSESGQKENALAAAESSRAMLLAQKLDGASPGLPRFRRVEAGRLARQTGTLYLSYWLAPDRSYLWAVSPKGISQYALPRESEINALVEQHRRAIENLQDPLEGGNAAARQLYRILLGPVEPLIPSAGTVVIVPDGRLHEINFETLVVDSANPHYWIEDASSELAPSLSVLRLETTGATQRPHVLIIGDPLPADAEFPPLPHLKAEISSIAAQFPEGDRSVYTGAQAYPDHFREIGPRAFNAIHFAAHAVANDQSPLNSAIILSPVANKYKLYASEVAGLKLNADLVTISACRSAGSKAYSGEGLIGFAWAFLEAGAHNVVAGIWNVDDAAAPEIMQKFYAHWREGQSPAMALRSAKLKLLHTNGSFRKPYYWGPFEVFTRQVEDGKQRK
ncbi:MAG TPA: CHAT domain-containing tetratricopeptide repeat protein [Bryobacteraceae bacterium]|nr:CHAT domain-containing tetratricopeptide repeat protein [Bryobacteraceae bacterium]